MKILIVYRRLKAFSGDWRT